VSSTFFETMLAWVLMFFSWLIHRLRTDMENDEWERGLRRRIERSAKQDPDSP